METPTDIVGSKPAEHRSDSAPASAPLGVSTGIEAVLRWLTTYPVYPLMVLLIVLIAFGGLGAELGIERLFWHDHPLYQLYVGYFIGLLFGVILFVEYLSNRPTRAADWLARRGYYSLSPSRDPEVRSLGRVLFWGLCPALVLMYAVKFYAAFNTKEEPEIAAGLTGWRGYIASRCYLIPFGIGYALSLVSFRLLSWVDERWGRWRTPDAPGRPLRERLLDWPVPLRGRLDQSGINPAEHGLHGIAVLVGLIAAAVLAVMVVVSWVFDRVWEAEAIMTPVPLVAVIMILFSLAYGVFAVHLHRQRLIVGGSLVLLLCWNSTSCFPGNHYKIRFPGMTYDRPTVLWDEKHAEEKTGNKQDWYRDVILASSRPDGDDLIDSDTPIREMSKRWQAAHGGQKPRLVFIATSGGGIRAAIWTAQVLNRLQEDPDPMRSRFRSNVRMITGASGGMVAAALYASDFEHAPRITDNPDVYTEVVATPCLSRTVQSLVLRDMVWNTALPPWGAAAWDRGRTLEWKWAVTARKHLEGRNPFGNTFRHLRELEKDGRRPSLVFSPMMIEDSRRLLISNLDLRDLTFQKTRAAGEPEGPGGRRDRFVSAVEFHRLFPDLPRERVKLPDGKEWPFATSEGFTVGTAARMSATFPVISPAVSLPTTPPRRVVDAGYYDNYGLNLAALWIWKHRKTLLEHTAGVAILEIRAFPLHEAGRRFAATNPQTGKPERSAGSGDLFTDAAAAISAPLEALFTARGNIAYYRNSEWVDVLREMFDAHDPDFFYNGWFELTRPASLNWYITDQEVRAITGAFREGSPKEQLEEFRRWFANGGK